MTDAGPLPRQTEDETDVFAAVLTAPGRGAIAAVRVWGDRAVPLVQSLFRPAGKAPWPSDAPRVGIFAPATHQAEPATGDEVVVSLIPHASEWSFGNPPLIVPSAQFPPDVEIQCHGGPEVIRMILRTLADEGASVVSSHVWMERRAPSVPVAEAVQAMTSAPTARVADILMDQAAGAWLSAITRLRTLRDPDQFRHDLAVLRNRATWGVKLLTGWEIALAGRPNVGKSALLNVFAGFPRAIVSETPGTTRDVITVRTAWNGWPVELADTAGLRDAANPLEAAGIALARRHHARADLVILVLDQSEPLTPEDADFLATYQSTAVILANKCDLPPAWSLGPIPVIAVSALHGTGIDQLMNAAISKLIPPEAEAPGIAVPFLPRHQEILDQMHQWTVTAKEPWDWDALQRLTELFFIG